MERGNDNSRIGSPAYSSFDPSFRASHVKLVQPVNVAIIAGLAAACWLPLAVSAYFLA